MKNRSKSVITIQICPCFSIHFIFIAKARAYLKPLMVQSALLLLKVNPILRSNTGVSKNGVATKKAIIAIARMMMVCIYHMISQKKPFTPTDYKELMDLQNHVERVIFREDNVFAYLEALGYDTFFNWGYNLLFKHAQKSTLFFK